MKRTSDEVRVDPFEPMGQESRWHAWRMTNRKGNATKVPVSKSGNARANDPTTWMHRSDAEELVARKKLSGLGVQLGILADDERVLIGVDLDTCLSTDQELEAWAASAVEIMGSYAEVSPSGMGLKIYALTTRQDVTQIEHLLAAGGGASWKFGNGQHPPAIEFYTRGRYFAVTLDHWPNSSDRLQIVGGDQLKELLELAETTKVAVEGRERPIGANGANGEVKTKLSGFYRLESWAEGPGPDQAQALDLITTGTCEAQRDKSRSGFEFQVAAYARRAGLSQAELFDALEELTRRRFGYGETGDERSASERTRAWRRCWERTGTSAQAVRSTAWETPNLAIFKEAPPPPRFPLEIFGSWSEWIDTAATAASAPPDYVAFALLTTAGALIGNSRVILPEPINTNWRTPVAFWTVLVGPPSSGKTPALSPFNQVLSEIEDEQHAAFLAARTATGKKRESAKEAQQEWKRRKSLAEKEGGSPPQMPDEAKMPDPVTAPPKMRTMDTTIEKLAVILSESPNGILQWRDELAAWFENMQRYSGASDRPQWLEMYNGGRIVIDRMRLDESITVPYALVSILGGIQPGRLEAIVDGPDDGLSARFIFIYPNSRPLERAFESADMGKLRRAIKRLWKLQSDIHGANGFKPVEVPFSAAAAERFFRFRQMTRQMSSETDGILAGWIGKADGLVARLAAVLGLLDWTQKGVWTLAPQSVSIDDLERACSLWTDYLLPMAKRTLGNGEPAEDRLAHWLIRKTRSIRAHTINRRDMRRDWGLPDYAKDKDVLNEALKILEADGLIRDARKRAGASQGRLREDWEVNPLIFDSPAANRANRANRAISVGPRVRKGGINLNNARRQE